MPKTTSLIFAIMLFLINPVWAFTCYITLAKGSCWKQYKLDVTVQDAQTKKTLTTVTVPTGQLWARATFPCETNGQVLSYSAQFSPEFWQSDANQKYYSTKTWSLPTQVKPGDTAWNVSVCFPADFSQVPYPPAASANCACDFSNIPAIPPKQMQP